MKYEMNKTSNRLFLHHAQGSTSLAPDVAVVEAVVTRSIHRTHPHHRTPDRSQAGQAHSEVPAAAVDEG